MKKSILINFIILACSISISKLIAQPTAVSTYNCLGLYWNGVGGADISCTTLYKKTNESTWKKAQALWWDARPSSVLHGNEYRGSIVGLEAGTTYDIKLTLSSGEEETITASTWVDVSKLPIAQTIHIPSGTNGYTITEGGSPSGYILYDGTSSTISGGTNAGVSIEADYIILKGLAISDVGKHGIELMSVKHVIIDDCDISTWGTLSIGGFQTEDDCGIWSNKCGLEVITIQNCKIHHPRYDANNWDEFNSEIDGNHPSGANAISFECQDDNTIPTTGNYVIRNNKIYSDYEHMFNDALGADNNFSYNGFPIRDSDIYGNEVSHVWDDALEIEGGNMNVRVWENTLDSINIAFGIASTSIGPLYIFRNISRWGKAKPNRDWGWSMFKIGIDISTYNQGAIFLYHNTIRQPNNHGVYSGLEPTQSSSVQNYITSRNNILQVHDSEGTSIKTDANTSMPNSTFDYDLCSGAVPSGSEMNGILNATPIYISETDLLDATSLGIDAGEILWNFNDPNSAWPYYGNGPEIGAKESPVYSQVTVPLRVNIGGAKYTAINEDVFLADQNYVTTASWGYNSTGYIENRIPVNIINTEDDDLYLTERWWEQSDTGAYVFNIPNGSYDLKLHFVEFNDVAIGAVVFDVKVENIVVLNDFDIRAEVAQQTALVKSIPAVVVSDETLNIDFESLDGSIGSKIMAIEVVDMSTSIADQLSTTNEFIIYPNPSLTSNTLNYNLSTKEQVKTLELFNINGKKIKSFIPNEDSSSFNIEGIAAGVYIVIANSNHQIYRQLLIIQ